MAAPELARGYQADVATLSSNTARLMSLLWRRIRPDQISTSWLEQLPTAVAVLAAGQTVAAELADPYLGAITPGPATDDIVPDSFAGATLTGEPLASLAYRPVIQTLSAVRDGLAVDAALAVGERVLTMYARTQTSDAARQAVSAGMGTRPHVKGFYRMLVGKSCSRCAILAGRLYARQEPFNRHPKCDCVHIPVAEADDSYVFDAKAAIEAGQVTGLSRAELRAIELGADPAAVVNARRGMYTTADGRFRYTREGASRRGVAGARILARDAARARGEDVAGRFFDNLVFSKAEADQYAALLRRGVKHTRLTATGREQGYRYSYARTARPTPEQIMKDAVTPEDARRLLINYGYVLDRNVIDRAREAIRLAGRDFDARLGIAAREADALRAVPKGLGKGGGLTAAERAGLYEYKSAFFQAINGQLRRSELGPTVARTVGRIDQVMSSSQLRTNVQVWRGIANPQRLFGDALDRDMTGVSWHELAYTSTSTSSRFARDFGIQGVGSTPVLMRILVPGRTGAARLGADQAEVLLERGLRFRVTRDRGVSPDGYRLIDVEVIGR